MDIIDFFFLYYDRLQLFVDTDLCTGTRARQKPQTRVLLYTGGNCYNSGEGARVHFAFPLRKRKAQNFYVHRVVDVNIYIYMYMENQIPPFVVRQYVNSAEILQPDVIVTARRVLTAKRAKRAGYVMPPGDFNARSQYSVRIRCTRT